LLCFTMLGYVYFSYMCGMICLSEALKPHSARLTGLWESKFHQRYLRV